MACEARPGFISRAKQRSQEHHMVCPKQRAAALLALPSLTPSYLKQLHLPLQAMGAMGWHLCHQKLPPAFVRENTAVLNPSRSLPQAWALSRDFCASLQPCPCLQLLSCTPANANYTPTPQISLLMRSNLECMPGSLGNQGA